MSENPVIARYVAQMEAEWDAAFVMARRVMQRHEPERFDTDKDLNHYWGAMPLVAMQVVTQISQASNFYRGCPEREKEEVMDAGGARAARAGAEGQEMTPEERAKRIVEALYVGVYGPDVVIAQAIREAEIDAAKDAKKEERRRVKTVIDLMPEPMRSNAIGFIFPTPPKPVEKLWTDLSKGE